LQAEREHHDQSDELALHDFKDNPRCAPPQLRRRVLIA
jgi:hypothetical protein